MLNTSNYLRTIINIYIKKYTKDMYVNLCVSSTKKDLIITISSCSENAAFLHQGAGIDQQRTRVSESFYFGYNSFATSIVLAIHFGTVHISVEGQSVYCLMICVSIVKVDDKERLRRERYDLERTNILLKQITHTIFFDHGSQKDGEV